MLSLVLHDLGQAYGDFDAHDGLWRMCELTANDWLARADASLYRSKAGGRDRVTLAA